jgi:hypothetical protein
LTLALSTPVWRRVKFAVTFPFHPLETVDCDSSSDDAASKSGKQTRKPKRRLRKFKKVNKKIDDYRENDFWQVNRENIEDTYEVPAHNRQSEDPADGKSGSWRSSHKSLSWKNKAGKKNQDKPANKAANNPV